MGKIKLIIIGLVAGFLVAAAVMGLVAARGCAKTSSSTGGALPLGFAPPKVETTRSWYSLGPRRRADDVLKGAPPGTRAVELPPSETPTLVWITPAGEVLTPQGTGVIFIKPRSSIRLETRPVIGVGISGAPPIKLSIMAGIDFLKIGPARIGGGIIVAPVKPLSVAAGAIAGADVYKNIGIRGFGGLGNSGWTFGVTGTLAIK